MKTEMKHTPGPWGRNIPPAEKYPIIYAGRNTHVARVITQGLPVEQQEANTNLIAAAPELLAALRSLASSKACGKRILPSQWACANAAIACATGAAQ